MPFLVNTLGPIIAQMGLLLLRERVVRKVTVITLRYLESKTSNKLTKDLVDAVADALEPPAEVGK
jgi:hypothetical protein